MVDLEEVITKPRRSATSLSELAPWFGMVTDDIVLCNDGSLLVGYTFEGLAMEGVDDEVLNAQIKVMQRSLRGVGERLTMWSFVDRRTDTSYTGGTFTNRVAQQVDEQWEKRATQRPHAALRHEVYIGYRFNASSFAFFDAVRLEMEAGVNAFVAVAKVVKRQLSAGGTVAGVEGQLQEMMADFRQMLSSFEGVVGPRLGFLKLTSGDFLGRLYGRFNLASPPGPLELPERLSYLAQAIPTDTIVRQGNLFEFHGPTRQVHVAALSTIGMPEELYSIHLDQMLGIDCEFTVCQMFEFLETTKAQAAIQAAEQYYKMEVKSLTTRTLEKVFQKEIDKVNTGNLHLAADAQNALAEITSSEVTYGYYAMVILAIGNSAAEANRSVDMISGLMRANGYGLTREVNGLMSAFLTTLPGNSKTAVRKYLASSANLADLVPLRTIRSGQPRHEFFSNLLARSVPSHIKFPTASGVPYDFSPHEMDLGHTAIIGGSGAGKTTLMHLFTALFQKYHPCNTFIFDKDHSMMVLTLLLGGRHIDMQVKEGKRVGMNPVKRMLENDDVLVLRSWLAVLICAGDKTAKISGTDNEDLFKSIKEVQLLGPSFWRLGQIYANVKGRNPDLALRLSPYIDRSEDEQDETRKGPFATFFDNEEDSFSLGSFVGMETGKLLMTPEVASPFMDYAFYCIEQKLDGNTPTFIYVEEAWYMLENPAFAEKMDDWLRTLRKKKAFLVFATQALDEIKKLKSLGAFIANVPTRIFLPSLNNSVAANADMYRSIFDLNDAQLEILSSALPKRDYLIVKGTETRLVEADVPDIILKINDATARTHYREVASAMAAKNEIGWQQTYLREVINVQGI